ncbi:MAG: hypothetical protein IJ496_05145 [Ruminococcus sp.]|nr:hypothetical protein [Ruminococcus sp.]
MKNKKAFTAGIASVISSAVLVSAAAAAYQYTLSDAKRLQETLAARSALRPEDDINGDGYVNIYDLSILKGQLQADTGEAAESTVPATAEYVKLQGRNLQKDGITWLVQSGSAAEFTVTGTSAVLSLAGDGGIYSEADFRPRYAVYVDGELILDKTMDAETETVTLFEGSLSRTAEVKVMLLSEAMYGGLGISGITAVSSAAVPVKPAAQNDLCIEFIGDSITCGYGVEGLNNYETFKTTTENFSKSYAYLTAQQLGADYSAVCYSGHGVVSGYSSGDKNAEGLVPDYYTLTSKQSDYAVPWDFSVRANDAVVINLGTNDINYVSAEFETRSVEFTEGYLAFLKTIREKNPDAYIICTLGTMDGADLYPLIEEAVSAFRTQVDDKIMCYASAVQNGNADGYGSDWHPSEITQQNSAYVLADKICQALGMESSQIGLDMAADGVYDVSMNTESGANAAFYVGYDKSFWVNMVEGGDSADDIEALISGISLKAGGEYRLQFDYTTTVDTEIPVLVRGDEEYFSGRVSAVSDKLHFEETFTAAQDDAGVEIVFQLGGLDYYNVTLSNVKLVKIG